MDNGTLSFWNFLHVSGYIYGICFATGMMVGIVVGRL